MIKAHMYWMQGWDNAPPKALRNAEAWKKAGFDLYLWDDSNNQIKFPSNFNPAMRADITLAKYQYKMGGLALGADMSPLDVDSLKKSISVLPEGVGQVVWQSSASYSKKSRPYNGGSYFPKDNPFIKKVVNEHLKVLDTEFKTPPNPARYTGPGLWRTILAESSKTVNKVCGSKVFLTEPRVDKISEVAWIDAGFAGDWKGEKKDIWQ